MDNSLTPETHLEYGTKLQLCLDFTSCFGSVFNHHYGYKHPVSRLSHKACKALWNMKDGLDNLVRHENRKTPTADVINAYSHARYRLNIPVSLYQPTDNYPKNPIPLCFESYLECGARFQLCVDFIFRFVILLRDVYGSKHKVSRLSQKTYEVLREMKASFESSIVFENRELQGPDWDEIYRCPKSFMSITDPLHLLRMQDK